MTEENKIRLLLGFAFPSPSFSPVETCQSLFKAYIGLFCSMGDIIKALNPLMREMCAA